jgi:hypothetical protein
VPPNPRLQGRRHAPAAEPQAVRHASSGAVLRPKEMARWESLRRQGMRRFVLAWGVLRMGAVFLLLEALTTGLAFLDARRIIRASGLSPSLRFSDYLAIVLGFWPRILLFAFGGGAAFAILMWFVMEARYRREVQCA